jgi:glycosyltransferase involved in cell wall biosynthesis
LLVEAVESVLAQTYRDFELIVADDGSGDETAARVAAFGDAVRYLALPHSGRPEEVRNQAIAAARGRFLAFLDDDDLWHAEKLARQVARLQQDRQIGYVYCDCRFLHQDGTLSPPVLPPQHKDEAATFENLLQGCFVHPSTVLMRRTLFEKVGPFSDQFFSQGDYDLWLQAAWVAPVACVPEPLVYLRHYEDGLALQRDTLNYEYAILVLEALRRRLPLTLRQRWLSRRALSRWYVHLALRREATPAARHDLVRSLRLNPLQRAAWRALFHR